MPLPVSVIVVVTQGASTLLIKNEAKEWTLPGGHPKQEEESIKEFAKDLLYPFFTDLKIRSVHLLMPPITDMVLKDERSRVAVFKCEIEGDIIPEAKDLVWFANLSLIPPHAVSPDIGGILDHIVNALDHFSKEHS